MQAVSNVVSPGTRLQLSLVQHDEIFDFVRQRFSEQHAAMIQQLMPWQCCLRGASGEILASAGMNPAFVGPLFLEHYLTVPVEQQLAARLQQPVARDEILEIGNLAASPGQGRWLVLALTAYLATQGYRYVVFTATDQVRALFHALALQPLWLQSAERTAVPEPERWGRYYERDPQVVAGEIRQGWTLLQQQPRLLSRLPQLPHQDLPLPGMEASR